MLTLLCFAVAARVQLEVTPVEKVVTLLEDLQSQVQDEGGAEADTYDKFACFCKDKTNAKVDSINEGETTIETLTADLKEMTEIREKEHAIYEVEYADASA